ncbi:opacity family porin [Pasteurella dagmatis]|nr:porin, opacity type [Pasteurella dagmatis]
MMKKSLLVLAMGTLFAATASANFYVQGDLGTSKVKWSGDGESSSKTGFSPSLSVGYKLTDFRLALDYTKYADVKYSYVDEEDLANVFVSASGKFKTESLGLSAIYDIDLNSNLTPYVGARIAVNRFSLKESGTERHVTPNMQGKDKIVKTNESYKETKVGYGILAGVSYKFTDSLAANAGLEYNHLGSFDGVKARQYGAKVGLRYEF